MAPPVNHPKPPAAHHAAAPAAKHPAPPAAKHTPPPAAKAPAHPAVKHPAAPAAKPPAHPAAKHPAAPAAKHPTNPVAKHKLGAPVTRSMIAKLGVAIYKPDGGIFKHWSLFIETAKLEDSVIVHIMGSSQRFRFEERHSNVRESTRLLELIHLCDVPIGEVEKIKHQAKNLKIHNEVPGFNCQDWMLDLLEDLETHKIIDGTNPDYKTHKEALKGKQDGLH